MRKILLILVLFCLFIGQISANFTNDWSIENFDSRGILNLGIVDNITYTYNFPKNFKVIKANTESYVRNYTPELVYENPIFDELIKKLWKEKTKELFDMQIIKMVWRYAKGLGLFDKLNYTNLDLKQYEEKEKVVSVVEIDTHWSTIQKGQRTIERTWKFFKETFLIEPTWDKKLKMNIEVLKGWNICNYKKDEPDEKKAKLCLYDSSLFPVDFTVNYQIFDKNNKEKTKLEKKLPIKYKFVKENWTTYYRPYLELDLDFNNIMKDWDLLKLSMEYTRYNHGY